MDNYQKRIEISKKALVEAEFILIGAGAGLSAAAGITYSGKRFTDNFGPFIVKYGFTDLYSSSFYPFGTEEEKWAYWAKHISLNRYEIGATKLYEDLVELVANKKYFIISTNVESQFEKAGFPSEKVFQIQGDYGYLQCEKGCHDKLYENESLVTTMINKTSRCQIPSNLVPRCPICGGPMDVNLRKNAFFVQDESWHASDNRYKKFLQESIGKKIVYIELGVGFNTPGIIRYPFERMTYHNERATLIRLNKDHPECFEENRGKTISFTEDMQQVVTGFM
ncbi:Sir2 silent information regulator family NAD-dependent deacetylase [Saliterribacillus persicus]|uniref:NAD-dependent SIR2 family protein deacetylase n=1 Tax=Saliterribacillus persicus TaxID=930114 RepID=A0A368X5Q3_9BACI|nr:Sir2 silent information regulator family NAD-dependent deacetylase [Saliterribacillus persicus]RCW63145.1 NAD-dependent SIR2 family protein deacetylase [Saliterribacillus persicus]